MRGEVATGRGLAGGRPSLGRRSRQRWPSRAGGEELQDALLDRQPEDVGDDHWKISVVQSPPWRRTSCARAGPPGGRGGRRRSRGRPPSRRRVAVDAQQPGAEARVELVVPGRVERVRDVEPAPVERELQHLRAAVQVASRVARLAEQRRRARAGRSASGWRGRRRRTGAGRRAASWRSRGSGRPSRARGRVIRPGTGKGQPSSSTGSTAITWSAAQPPLSRRKRHIVLESAAPTKPSSASGSCFQRTSSGPARSRRGRRSARASARPGSRSGGGARSGPPRRRRGRTPSRRRSARRTRRRRARSCAAGTRSRS